MSYPIDVAIDEGRQLVVDLRWRGDRGSWLEFRDGILHHDLPSGVHIYLTPSGSSDFSVVPERGQLHLDGGSTYRFQAVIDCEGGQSGLWIIEYNEKGRLQHEARHLSSGPLEFTWTTHDQQQASTLALRVTGTGRLAIRNLTIAKITTSNGCGWTSPGEASTGVLTGPEGRWCRWSQFFDPVGYRSYTERHHRFYDDRGAELYGNALAALKGCRRILDVACGPGLLLRELLNAGAQSVVGLERDPVYLERCRSRGLDVHAHDLNHPFPYLAGRDFDAVVFHQAIDYLAPLSMRIVLRESNRVLRDDGLLHLASRMDGQQTGDLCRSIRLNRERLDELLHEAGFEIEEFVADGKNLRLNARVKGRRNPWKGRTVSLSSGPVVHPWSAPRRILDQQPEPWDSEGNRDFTLLTDESKAIVRQDNKLVAYYTGYHQGETGLERAVCRAVSDDGVTWRRDPDRPVLTAGKNRCFDSGGVCCGSVLACADGPDPYVMYFSGKAADGTWPAIGAAWSDNGVEWRRQAEPVLRREEFENIKHLALADVIRTTDGVWLLHAESWIDGKGWAISQARSQDGRRWQPTRTTPVLAPADIPWGNCHVANPKVIELEAGSFVMGFNAAGPKLDFHIGLAESRDAEAWRPLAINPVVCASAGEFRVESMFMTREAWTGADRRAYFFSASSQLEPGSNTVCATADTGAAWVGDGWETSRPARYRIRGSTLEAQAQGKDEDGLQKHWPLDRETQACVRLAPESTGTGGVELKIRGEERSFVLTLWGNGALKVDGETAVEAGNVSSASCCLRCIRPWSGDAEVHVLAWQGASLVLERHCRIGFRPRGLTVGITVPPGQPLLVVDSVDVWQPDVLGLENNDAWTLVGDRGDGHSSGVSVDSNTFANLMEAGAVDRALVFPCEPNAGLDSYDQIAAQIPRMLGRVYPCLRLPLLSSDSTDAQTFEATQLEHLWQAGVLFGFEAQLAPALAPGTETLKWAEDRQALALWRASTKEQLEWLRRNVLEKYHFPTLLLPAVIGAEDLLQLLDGYPQLHLVAGPEMATELLARAIRKFPDRVLLGSGFPYASRSVACARIDQLDVDANAKVMVLSSNLNFLLERAQTLRWQDLHHGGNLHFPRIPTNPAELAGQGFVVVPSERLDAGEPDSARTYWSTLDVQPFYGQAKPWATWIADVVKEIRPLSVLEFGCNLGRNLATIRAACSPARLVGLDINAGAVAAGRAESGLDLRVGGEEALVGFEDDEFDFVFTVSVLDHIPNIDRTLEELVRVCRGHLFLLEVGLPLEGKVLRHFDHRENRVKESTTASYSWQLEGRLVGHPKVARLDTRPVYLHSASLGPCYVRCLAVMDTASRALGPGSRFCRAGRGLGWTRV